MYNKKRIELIVKDWVKLKTGIELSDDTISKMVDDITSLENEIDASNAYQSKLKEKNKLLKRYEKVCKELESLAWKEYEQGFGTQRRANTSRKCDGLAIEKRNLRNRLFNEFNIEL